MYIIVSYSRIESPEMTEFPWDYRSITEYSIKTKKKLKDEKRKEKKKRG